MKTVAVKYSLLVVDRNLWFLLSDVERCWIYPLSNGGYQLYRYGLVGFEAGGGGRGCAAAPLMS